MEFGAAFFLDPLRRWAPRAALLSALAGIAITFISMGFAFQIFASPAISLAPMLLIVVAYAARLRLPLGIPAGLCAILLGVLVAWGLRAFGLPSFAATTPTAPGLFLPTLDSAGLGAFFQEGGFWRFLPVIFPMALFNVLGSLQTLESAEAAGDRYATRSSLAMNGIGSLVAGMFGSAFPTTLYIGHPGWKAMGARIGYSALNGIVIGLLSFTGAVTLILVVVPMEATLGILIWIGVVIAAQAFQETPKAHAVAVAAGLLPALAAWAQLLIETSLRAAGSSLEAAIPKFGNELFIHGVLALSQGFLLTSMGFAAIVAFSIDRKFIAAAVSAFACAAFSAIGLIHAYTVGPGGIEPRITWMVAPEFVFAYALTGFALLAMSLVREPAMATESMASPKERV